MATALAGAGGARPPLSQRPVQEQFENALTLRSFDLATELLEFAGAQVNYQNKSSGTTFPNVELLGSMFDSTFARSSYQKSSGRTPLIQELQDWGRKEVVAFLLSNGARLDLVDDKGQTALHVAAFQGCSADVIRLLLQHKPPINAQDHEGQTPLYASITQYKDEAMKILVEEGNANINIPERGGATPLHFCCSWGPYDRAKYFFDRGADVNPAPKTGFAPFYSALYRCRKEELPFDQLALDIIPKLKEVDQPNLFGDYPLHACVQRHKFDFKGFDGFDRTPHIRALLARNATVDCVDQFGSTPLHLAVRGKKEDLLPVFIAAKADVNKPDKRGITPIQTAASDNSPDMVKFLFQNGATVPEAAKQAFEADDVATAIDMIKLSIPKLPASSLNRGPIGNMSAMSIKV